MQPNLYMVALMPDGYLTDVIDSIRKDFSNVYGAKAALRPPVHVTLLPPFKTAPETAELLLPVFRQVADHTAPFSVRLYDYGFFREDVVYLNVLKDASLLHLQAQVEEAYKKELPSSADARAYSGFNPHITIGYRDIPEGVFPAIRQQYSGLVFRDSFTVRSFYLWQHNGRFWEIHTEFPLNRYRPGTPEGEDPLPISDL